MSAAHRTDWSAVSQLSALWTCGPPRLVDISRQAVHSPVAGLRRQPFNWHTVQMTKSSWGLGAVDFTGGDNFGCRSMNSAGERCCDTTGCCCCCCCRRFMFEATRFISFSVPINRLHVIIPEPNLQQSDHTRRGISRVVGCTLWLHERYCWWILFTA